MLVLARRAHQQIVFPHLGIRISVLQVKGRLVKMGIEAPNSVKVLREELSLERDLDPAFKAGDAAAAGQLDHQRRNDLNLLHLRLAAIQKRIDRGESVDAEAALDSLLGKVSTIDHELVEDGSGKAPLKQGRRIRLLVVEDSDNERELMSYLLASRGFDVRAVRDGLEALEQLQVVCFEPDFVLMDMQMPLSNGLETLLRIRSDKHSSVSRCLPSPACVETTITSR